MTMLDEFTRRLLFVIEPELYRETPNAARIVARVIQELGLRELEHVTLLPAAELAGYNPGDVKLLYERADHRHRAGIGHFLAQNMPMSTTRLADAPGRAVRICTSVMVITRQSEG